MNRFAGLAATAALLASSAVATGAGCSSSSPAPFTSDAGGPVVDETLTVGFSGTGTGTVSVVSDSVSADASAAQVTCSAACTESYPSTASVNLTATAAADSIFDGWDPATSDMSCPTVSLTMSVTCTAIFQKMTVVPDDAGPGTDAAAGDANGGASDAGDASGG